MERRHGAAGRCGWSTPAGLSVQKKADQLNQRVWQHLQRAVQEADYLLILCDAQEGMVPVDTMIVETLRKTGKPMALVANKADHRLTVPPDCFTLGIETVFATSALHGLGIGELLDHLVDRPPPCPSVQRADSSAPRRLAGGATPAAMAIAIVGRPNVGKSSLFNALLREERVIVSDQPGTTRDTIDTPLLVDGDPVMLIDTAGLKHRRKVKNPLEVFAMAQAVKAIERCDVALVLLDGTQGVVRDDKRLVERVAAMGRGLLLLINKWDLVKQVPQHRLTEAVQHRLTEAVHRQLPMARFAPILPISAKTGLGVWAGCAKAREVFRAMQGVPEEELAAYIRSAWASRPPPRVRGRTIRCDGARWLGSRPARIQILTTPAAILPHGYQRYLLNRLSAWRRLAGVPVQLIQGQVKRR